MVAKQHGYASATNPYRIATESDMLDRAIETFHGRAIALVSDDMGDTVQIWRKKVELKFMGGDR